MIGRALQQLDALRCQPDAAEAEAAVGDAR